MLGFFNILGVLGLARNIRVILYFFLMLQSFLRYSAMNFIQEKILSGLKMFADEKILCFFIFSAET